MPRLSLALLSPLLLLAACATPATDESAATGGSCNADAAQAWLGKPASAANVDAAFKASGAVALNQKDFVVGDVAAFAVG